ncbi:MAG: anti-sigma factor family protein [Terriglobia bacterium]
MRFVDIGNADCKKARALLDAYLSNELIAETTSQISGHLEKCDGCREKFSVREQIKRRLQLTVSRDEVPPELRRRISRMLRRTSGIRISRLFE